MIKKMLVYLILASTLSAQEESQGLLYSTREITEKITTIELACKKSKLKTLQKLLEKKSYKEIIQVISDEKYTSWCQSLRNNYCTNWDAVEIGYKAGSSSSVIVWTGSVSIGLTAFASSFFTDNEDDLQKIYTIEKYCLGTFFLNCIASPLIAGIAAGTAHLHNRIADYKNLKITGMLATLAEIRQHTIKTARVEIITNKEDGQL